MWPDLGLLKNLRVLNVIDNKSLEEISFEQIKQVTSLVLNNTGVKNLEGLVKLEDLTDLYLTGGVFSELPIQGRGDVFSKLITLEISDNCNIVGNNLKGLSSFDSLRFVTLYDLNMKSEEDLPPGLKKPEDVLEYDEEEGWEAGKIKVFFQPKDCSNR